ncbi:DUF2231 domain-containing protein [Legionella impletisoli]|uniref:DUF2231 domain-containing protein n=1 Tax=Legionella impletisoli TaxID=343510 RepID=A0A917JUL2_9GAMM|nr:DUF2231 domain-containing protein [Legionella impletisoli]GGI87863.1 hypothetical protein GCM10007966_15770 [Legionella impletisoli]
MFEIIPNWHPVFVHFTVALVSVSAISYLLGHVLKDYPLGQELLTVGRWCLWFGLLASIATVSAGFIAYYSVAHDAQSHEAMTIHRNWALLTFSGIFIVTLWSFWRYFRHTHSSISFIVCMLILFVLITITAWHGAELVYRYGIGVMSLPSSTESGHHTQAESSEHTHNH